MNIITGYEGAPHVTSQQDRNTMIGVFGSGTKIIKNIGSEMAATIVSANEIQIADGMVSCEGCTADIEKGTVESMAIENGEQGMKRIDLIVARYSKNMGTAVESMDLVVIKGTPAASNPVAPSYNEGVISDGDSPVDFPIYRVNLDGITIESVVLLAGYAELASKPVVDDLSNKMGTGTLNTTAKKVIAAINEVFATLTNAVSRIAALETRTAGIVRTSAFSVAGGATDYKQLTAVATYMLIVGSAYPSAAMKGMYLIGVAGTNEISIKAVSTASDVAVSDAGNGLLRIKNNGNAYIRCTLMTTYGG